MARFFVDQLKAKDAVFCRVTTGELQNAQGGKDKIEGAAELVVVRVENDIQVRVARLALHSLGQVAWRGTRGLLTVSTRRGEGRIQRDGSRLDLGFSAEVRYAEVTRDGYIGLELRPGGARMPPRLHFTGTLVGRIESPGQSEDWRLLDASLRLAEVPPGDRGLSRVEPQQEGLSILLEADMSVEPPLADCPEEQQGCNATVVVRPVFFKNDGAIPVQTGSTFKGQLEKANKIWQRCCVQFTVEEEPIIIENSSARGSGRIEEVLRTVCRAERSRHIVHVYCVDGLASGDGGGDTEWYDILIEDKNSGNPVLLAHELGHFLELCHLPSPNVMNPSCGPNQPGEEANPLSNCDLINLGGLTLGFRCCMPPDRADALHGAKLR